MSSAVGGTIVDATAPFNTKTLIKNLIHSFPDDLSLSDSVHGLSDTSPLNLDEQNSGLLTPIKRDRSSDSTPDLSLPDSFDVEVADLLRNRGILHESVPIAKSVLGKSVCSRCSGLEAEKSALLAGAAEHKHSFEQILLQRDTANIELQRVRSVARIEAENQRTEVVALTDRALRLSNLLEAEAAQRRTCEEKASRSDLAEAQLRKLQRENEELRDAMEQQAKAVRVLTMSEEASRKLAADAGRVKELLVMDKTHLQQELSSMEGRCEDRRRGQDTARSHSASLEAKVAQLTDQLLSLQLSARSGFDDRMDKELQRIRQESARELEGLKATSKEILDRENRVLREARTSLENECTQLRTRHDGLGRQVGALQDEKAALAHEKNSAISELRGELKIKSFELTSLGVSFEQRMGQLRQTELELEVLRQEITAHRSALLRMERDSAQETRGLRSDLEQASARLHAYEALEEEIDSAVVRTAQGDGAGAGGLADTEQEAAERLVGSVRGIPTDPRRRVKQAVFLAQRLLEAEKQRDAGRAMAANLQTQLREARRAADMARENLTRAAQPTTYLVGKLRDEEGARAAAVSRCALVQAQLLQSQKRALLNGQEAAALRERLEELLQQRGELETVKVML
ncbi:hypothetical protein B484DRAFT_458140, partial [Ochromonadaceae sp. CCMP2298]